MDIVEKEKIDLVAVVEHAGVDLKRSGSRHVGLCPFHADQAPSFFVFQDSHFHCFGCGEHGDVFDFVEKFHGCDFKGALRILGIERGKLTPQERQEVKRLKHRRELVKRFREWEALAADYAALLCRCARKLLGNIETEGDLEKYGHLYHHLESWQHHLDILIDGDDEAKLELHNVGYY